jgi:hypothetical protein
VTRQQPRNRQPQGLFPDALDLAEESLGDLLSNLVNCRKMQLDTSSEGVIHGGSSPDESSVEVVLESGQGSGERQIRMKMRSKDHCS